jgi:TolB-like protein/Tfp pilus assembly protein PilF
MLRLRLFGGFRAAGAKGAERAIKSRKAKGLLAYLALTPRQSRSREELMALLWSDRGEAQARASLRQALVGLRKDLGPDAEALIVTNDAVALDSDRVVVEDAGDGEELLAGLHIHDPAFEEWLRDERLRLEDDAPDPGAQPAGLPLPDKPSVAVLPFANLSGDPEQVYFAEGLTGDIITQLSRFRSLFVIDSVSSFHYRGTTPKAQEVGRELGVAYIVVGGVRKAGKRVRITVELVEAALGRQIWAERFDRDLEDVFAVQDEVTDKVVSTLVGYIEDLGRRRAADKRREDLAAYDWVLLGEEAQREGTREAILRARALFQQAIDRDPGNARAHASMARSHLDEVESDWSTAPEAAGEEAFAWAQKAVALDELDNRARANLAFAYFWVKSNFEAAQVQFDKALELNPNDADAYCLKGWCHVLAGQGEQAIACTDRAMRLNPFYTYDCSLAQFLAHYGARRYEDALLALGRIPDPGHDIDALRAACYARLGREAEAGQAMDRFVAAAAEASASWPEEDPEAWRRYWAKRYPFQDASDLEHLLDGFRKAGLAV